MIVEIEDPVVSVNTANDFFMDVSKDVVDTVKQFYGISNAVTPDGEVCEDPEGEIELIAEVADIIQERTITHIEENFLPNADQAQHLVISAKKQLIEFFQSSMEEAAAR